MADKRLRDKKILLTATKEVEILESYDHQSPEGIYTGHGTGRFIVEVIN